MDGPDHPVVRIGTLVLLRRFPLRSALGEEPQGARWLRGGLEHDRRWHLVAADGAPVHRRDAPGLAALHASAGPGGALLLRDASGALLDPAAAARALAGAGARFTEDPSPHRAGAAVHLVAERVTEAPGAREALLGGCDPGERANAVVALEPVLAAGTAAALGLVPGGAAEGLAGRRLAVGGAVVELTRAPRRCLGVYADVAVEGPVAAGDDVLLLHGP